MARLSMVAAPPKISNVFQRDKSVCFIASFF
jgi:hypothetical protein